MQVGRSKLNIRQRCVEVPSNRVLRFRSFVHNPGLPETTLSARSVFWVRLQDITEEVYTGSAKAHVFNGRGGEMRL